MTHSHHYSVHTFCFALHSHKLGQAATQVSSKQDMQQLHDLGRLASLGGYGKHGASQDSFRAMEFCINIRMPELQVRGSNFILDHAQTGRFGL